MTYVRGASAHRLRAMEYYRERGDSAEWTIAAPEGYRNGDDGAGGRLEFETPQETITINGVADGEAWKFTLTPDDARRVITGERGYRFVLFATGKQVTAESGRVYVGDGTAPDGDDEELLKLLKAVRLQKVAGRGDIGNYTIGSTAYSTMTLEELDRAINRCQERINMKRGGKFQRTALVGGFGGKWGGGGSAGGFY